MGLDTCLSIWGRLSIEEQAILEKSAFCRIEEANVPLFNSTHDCMGLIVMESGQLRAYMTSEEGKEITLYRLLPQDICLFSASCAMKNIQFEIQLETKQDSKFWVIPTNIYQKLVNSSVIFSNYANEIMSSRFSEVMWLMEQILWKGLDKRLSAFLLEESTLLETTEMKITHEQIANHIGSSREVITRMLKYFQKEGMVKLSRGTVIICDWKGLETLLF